MKRYEDRVVIVVCQLQRSVLKKVVLAVQLADSLPPSNVLFFPSLSSVDVSALFSVLLCHTVAS